jgi:hypothetical protein
MRARKTSQIEARIVRVKRALEKVGPMRPGSLTRQYKNPKEKSGAYWQISYTRNMKSRTEYVRREWVAAIRKEIAAYKRFKSLTEEWIDLSIEMSKRRMQMD